MVALLFCAFVCFLATVSARAIPNDHMENLCGNLGGYWVNELNSMMYIIVGANGELSGQYGTAVETSSGASGDGKAVLSGRIVGSVVTFNAAWNGGESMTTWIGQCYHHNEVGKPQPALLSTWILKSVTENIGDNWMTNRIGFDTFYRKA